MDKSDRLFDHGRANPEKFGCPIRSSAGKAPDLQRLEDAAALLGRPVFLVDGDGYECEIIGAAVNATGHIAYVESRAKDVGSHIDVSIRIHLVERAGRHDSADIQSYNPFFGCDVRFFEWVDATAVLIYREKHWTFACRFGDVWPPRFVKIADNWVITGNVLSFRGYKATNVCRLSFPSLDELDPIAMSEAAKIGLFPDPKQPHNQPPQRTGAAGILSRIGKWLGRGPGR